jgi:hypothetical protein
VDDSRAAEDRHCAKKGNTSRLAAGGMVLADYELDPSETARLEPEEKVAPALLALAIGQLDSVVLIEDAGLARRG